METGSIDFCNFDSSWSGGPTEWRRAAAIASVYDVRMAHHEEPQVASHLLASIPHGTFLEYFHPQRDPIWHNIIANKPKLENGHIQLPTGPGLGWELDLDYIAKYRTELEVPEPTH
jgi:L-alanine-DL-glutamate epimerase-like enolase superfamily enzyme